MNYLFIARSDIHTPDEGPKVVITKSGTRETVCVKTGPNLFLVFINDIPEGIGSQLGILMA